MIENVHCQELPRIIFNEVIMDGTAYIIMVDSCQDGICNTSWVPPTS
jgi:hypothetical protein